MVGTFCPLQFLHVFFFFFNPGRVYIGFFRLNLILFQMLHIHAIFSTNIVLTFMKEYYTANVAVV